MQEANKDLKVVTSLIAGGMIVRMRAGEHEFNRRELSETSTQKQLYQDRNMCRLDWEIF